MPSRPWRWIAPSALALAVPLTALAQSSTPSATATAAPQQAVERAPSAYRAAQPDEAARVVEDAIDLVQQEYVDTRITREELVEAALQGIVDHLNRRALAEGLPPANSLLSRRDVTRLSDSMAGQQTGLGMMARSAGAYLDVIHVFPGSPAEKAGIRAGDHIQSVEGKAVENGADLLALLHGEEGIPVHLALMRDGTALEVKAVRGRFQVSTVSSALLEGEVGLIRIGSFTRGTAEDTAKALLNFRETGVWGVILDLRGNPGGSLDEAVQVASMFFDPGEPMMEIIGKNGQPQVVNSEGEHLWNGQVTVLVDAGTASAAEALASAIQCQKRGLLQGERTAGRGLAQSIFGLPGGGALRLATARYATSTGASWVARGLIPDQQVPNGLVLDPGEPLDPPLRNALNNMTVSHRNGAPSQADPNVANGNGNGNGNAADVQPVNVLRK